MLNEKKSAASLCRMLLPGDWQPQRFDDAMWNSIAKGVILAGGLFVDETWQARSLHPKPRGGPVPRAGDVHCAWDYKDGCWRASDGSVHVVTEHAQRKADAAAEQQRLRAEVERIDREVVQRLEAAGVDLIPHLNDRCVCLLPPTHPHTHPPAPVLAHAPTPPALCIGRMTVLRG